LPKRIRNNQNTTIMKKHIVTLLIVSVFAIASAQSYTQAFDSVFQHVDLSHTSTGILYHGYDISLNFAVKFYKIK